MEIGRHRGMIANEHIRIGSDSYEKVKTFKYLGSQNSKEEICVIISPNSLVNGNIVLDVFIICQKLRHVQVI